jgi:nonsense-mediated mRNA decay protein 3
MGYLTGSAVFNEADAKEIMGHTTNGKKRKVVDLPAVVLIRKSYPLWRRMRQGKARAFKLKHLTLGGAGTDELKDQNAADDDDLNDFMDDLEEDEELRDRINLYKNPDYNAASVEAERKAADVEEEVPEIDLDMLLEDLNLDDAEAGPDEADAAGAAMDDEFDDDDL